MSKIINKYKVYGRNKGRKKQRIVKDRSYNNYNLNFEKDIIKYKHYILDIGSGSGENSLHLAKKNPNKLIIACEVFEDGNHNLINELQKLKIDNIKLFTKNVLILLEKKDLNIFFDEVWILFPDPWPKKRHQKRRLISIEFLNKLFFFMNKGCKLFISTDSTSYFINIMKNIYKVKTDLKWNNDIPYDYSYSYNELPMTKFYKKAKNSYRNSFFIELIKI